MQYLPPYVIHGVHLLNNNDVADEIYAYKKMISFLRDELFDVNAFMKGDSLNQLMSQIKSDN
jgi:hypothetical protein